MQKEQETKAETTEKQHGKQTEETNINPCSSSSLCSNMKMQKNTRSWQSTDDHRVCRRPKSWHPCPGGGKGSYWACCCLHHTCTCRVASPEGVCGCQSEQNKDGEQSTGSHAKEEGRVATGHGSTQPAEEKPTVQHKARGKDAHEAGTHLGN